MSASISHAQEGPRYSHTDPTIISGVRVIDGLGNKPKENQDILIVNGKIAAIGSAGSLDAPKGALKIDGAGMTAMPGLIDPHIHLMGDWANGTLPETNTNRRTTTSPYSKLCPPISIRASRRCWIPEVLKSGLSRCEDGST